MRSCLVLALLVVKKLKQILLGLFLLAFCQIALAKNPIISLDVGDLEGIDKGQYDVFRGIPFQLVGSGVSHSPAFAKGMPRKTSIL